MMSAPDGREERLAAVLRGYGRMAVAYSGGVDSSLLLAAAADALGVGAVTAITVVSAFSPAGEADEAAALARQLGVPHEQLRADILGVAAVAANPVNRCYHCKLVLMEAIRGRAAALGFPVVAEGTTTDDLADHRPGRAACEELGIRSPLLEARLGKQDVRELSRARGLPTADRPSMACLASRIPHGTSITVDALHAVDEAETALRAMGLGQVRVRHHGDIARVELPAESLNAAGDPAWRAGIVAACRRAGFRYVALDLEGYRTGSLNPERERQGGRMGAEP